MNSVLTVDRQIHLVAMHCGECDITFAVPDSFKEERLNSGQAWYCPNGHGRVFKETEADRLRRRLRSLEATNTHLEDQRAAAERQARAYKGHATRLKKRAAAGVCPCCDRSFQNVARHMASQHPDFVEKAKTDA